jgi:predicted ATPase
MLLAMATGRARNERRTQRTRAKKPLTNLGPDRAVFLGRSGDLARLGALATENAPLVTITGPGGAGKTRLARHHAGAARPRRGGVWFCDLSNARTGDDIAFAVARALDLELTLGISQGDAIVQLGRALRARGPTLLVLDNFEHLLAYAARTVGAWISAAPELRVLATSREPLGLEGEICHELGPLGVEEAILLFDHRARAIDPAWTFAEADRPLLEHIVRRFDFLPLAIELAASRTDVLSIAELGARITESQQSLTNDRRDTVDRHATLRDVVLWSWDLLSPAERDALARCAVFSGEFPIDAAEVVLGGGAALELLRALKRKSLAYAAADKRLALYESVRELAREKLTESEACGEAEARFVAYFVAQAERWASETLGPSVRAALDSLARELENLLAARAYARGSSPESAIRIALALDRLLAQRGPTSLHRTVLDDAIEDARARSDAALKARVLLARGDHLANVRRFAESRRDAEEVIAIARALGVPSLEGGAHRVLCSLALTEERYEEAHLAGDRAVSLARAAGDELLEGEALGLTGVALDRLGRTDEAASVRSRSLAILERLGARQLEAATIGRFGVAARERGRAEEARHCLKRALAIHREDGNRLHEAYRLRELGKVEHHLTGDFDAARRHYRAAIAILESLGNRFVAGEAIVILAIAEIETENEEEAELLLARALSIFREIEDATYCTFTHYVRAHLELERKNGVLALAQAALDEAFAWHARGATLDISPLLALRAAIEASSGRDARASIESARERVARGGDVPELRAIVEICAVYCEVALSPEGPPDLVVQARARIRTALDLPGARSEPAVRLAVRLVDRALARRPPSGTLRVAQNGAFFELEGAARVELGRRRAPRRVLAALLAHRIAHPGEHLSWDALLAAGWPGQAISAVAARTRVHTAIYTLRRLGLGELLLTEDDAYALDPRAPIERAPIE